METSDVFANAVASALEESFTEGARRDGTYEEDEWNNLCASPFWIFNYIAAADDDINKKESKALEKFVKTIIKKSDNEFILSIFEYIKENRSKISEYSKSKIEDILDKIRNLNESLTKKTHPAKARVYINSMLLLAWTIASAAKEKDSIDLNVNPDEAKAIVDLASAYGVLASEISDIPEKGRALLKDFE